MKTAATGPSCTAKDEHKRRPGDLHGMVFQNISMAAHSILQEQQILWGMEDGLIYDLVFDNVMIGGETISSVEDFCHNEYVFDTIPHDRR